jgi:hypothetical protein
MRRFTVGLALTIAFVAGCVTSQLVVPRARAQAASVASRWEYICVDGWAGITHSANQLGKEGWELASAAGTSDHMMWCFKRPLP